MQHAYLHGFGSSAQSTKGTALRRALAPLGLELQLPDLNCPSFARLEIGAALRHLSVLSAPHDHWALIGSSLGGYLAALFACQHPARIQRLILLCPGFGLAERWPTLLGSAALHRWRHDGRLPFTNGAGVLEWVHWRFIEEASEHEAWPVPPCPTLIIHGRQDETVPITGSRQVAQRHAHIELFEVEDDHGLVGSLPLIERACELFLVRQMPLTAVHAALGGASN